MPTISGLRKRGYTPESLRKFVELAGVGKRENLIDLSLLEFSAREHLNLISPRVMAVLNPVRLIIKNYPDNQDEILEGEINPEKPELGKRKIPFSKELYIEKEDFKEEANRKFYRLSIGKEVRLKNAYIIKAETVIKNNDGTIKEIICSYDPKSKSGSGSEESKRKVKGTIHWVTIKHSLNADVNVYDRLFMVPSPDHDKEIDFKKFINPNSLKTIKGFVEPSLFRALKGNHFQFQRLGYFILDEINNEKLIFNKTVGLRDNWSKK